MSKDFAAKMIKNWNARFFEEFALAVEFLQEERIFY